MTSPLSPEDRTWLSRIDWTPPRTIYSLTQHGARTVIPTERGFYAFLQNSNPPQPSANCLYVGIAAGKTGLRGRLSSYLRTTVTEAKATAMKHRGKRLLSFARIKGLDGSGSATQNTEANDKALYVSWAVAPLSFGGSAAEAQETRRVAYMLERALIDRYRPLYNTADWTRDLELELDEDAYGGIDLD